MVHVMLLPTSACPASCRYCFGPNSANPGVGAVKMEQRVLAGAAAWIGAMPAEERVEVTFHGGEPLAAGSAFFHAALPLLARARLPGKIGFALQSNLWLLDDALCRLFLTHQLGLGTSLDGPEAINDAQRGAGYFRRTMAGLDLARRAGLKVGCIATLTAQSVGRWREVLAFFRAEGLNVSIHAALPVMGEAQNGFELSPQAYGEVLTEIFAEMLSWGDSPETRPIVVEPVRSICTGLHHGGGGMCVFGDCLGHHLAVGPDGSIYPCQRFVGMAGFRLGSVCESGSTPDLTDSPAWQLFSGREAQLGSECSGCDFFSLCRGGCPYNALAAGGGSFAAGLRDPYCPSYARILSTVVERAVAEVFSPANLAAVVDQPDEKSSLLRSGAVLRMMRGS